MRARKKVDPYQALGVDRDATAAEVKRAFRARAKQSHPDNGGSAAEFADLKSAQLMLCDPVRRARYDETGEADEPQPSNDQAQALQLIAKLLSSILGGDEDPFDVDLVGAMTMHFEGEIGAIRGDLAKLRRATARAQKMRGRFKRKGAEADNVLVRLLEQQEAGIAAAAALAEQGIRHRETVIALLKDYRFEVEVDEAFPMYSPFSAFSVRFSAT